MFYGRSTSVSLPHILIPVCQMVVICNASTAQGIPWYKTLQPLVKFRYKNHFDKFSKNLVVLQMWHQDSWMKVVWPSTPLGTSLHHLFVIWHCCRWLYLAGTLNPCVSLSPRLSTPKVYLYLGETQGAVKNINISWAEDKKGLLLSSK